MAYQKPGVTVRQVQATQSFPLPAPTSKACVVGAGYYWQDINADSAKAVGVYNVDTVDNLVIELTASGATGLLVPSPYSNIIESSVIVELVTKSPAAGVPVGTRYILDNGGDFTVSGDTVTIASGAVATPAATDCEVRIGFLASNTDLNEQYKEVSDFALEAKELITGNVIADGVSPAQWFNPLAFSANLAARAEFSIYGVTPAAGSENFAGAASALSNKPEVYAIAALTSQVAQITTMEEHAVAMALPENKGERIVFASRDSSGDYVFTNPPTTEEKNTAALAIATYASGVNNKRYFNIHPDVVYVEQLTHISTLKTEFIQGIFGSFPHLPKFARRTTIGGTTYSAGTVITEAIRTAWVASLEGSTALVTALIPVPGYLVAGALAGEVSVKQPQQPLTNTAVPAVADVKNSNDFFSQAQLNTIAGGGNWVLENRAGTVFNRHQMSTAASTVQTRELSITTAVDYASKYLREAVSPFIGVNVISEATLGTLRAVLNQAAGYLVEVGYVADLSINSVSQDEENPDKVNVEVSVLPLYPVNYINITLTF